MNWGINLLQFTLIQVGLRWIRKYGVSNKPGFNLSHRQAKHEAAWYHRTVNSGQTEKTSSSTGTENERSICVYRERELRDRKNYSKLEFFWRFQYFFTVIQNTVRIFRNTASSMRGAWKGLPWILSTRWNKERDQERGNEAGLICMHVVFWCTLTVTGSQRRWFWNWRQHVFFLWWDPHGIASY